YIDGLGLNEYLKQQGVLSLAETRAMLHEIASALDYAHERGLVHRDIKPSNVMLRANGPVPHAVLMDFGIAKLRDSQTRYTGSGAIGTIDYMAPEQILAAREVDHRADVYALGVMTFEMLTGRHPFEGGPAQVMFAHLQQPAPDARSLKPDLPDAPAQALLRALAKDPAERFASAGAFVQSL
ncbi:MAG: serine/threonine-protein kinase, partial [Anaerolineae bacterium]